MSESFKIFVDRLKGGQTHKLDGAYDPTFLGPNEPELRFDEKVVIKGETYLTDDNLIIHLKAHTKATMPCAVCNEMIRVDLKVDNFYHLVPIEEVPTAVFDCSELLREALLIELPKTAECKGNCPGREMLKPYLRKEKNNFPFADL